jgi:hypothetical protein
VKKPQEKQKRQTNIASLPTVMSAEVTKTRTNEVRLQLMIHTKKKSNRTAYTVCRDHIKSIFQALQGEDDTPLDDRHQKQYPIDYQHPTLSQNVDGNKALRQNQYERHPE